MLSSTKKIVERTDAMESMIALRMASDVDSWPPGESHESASRPFEQLLKHTWPGKILFQTPLFTLRDQFAMSAT
jgi:hypothetical protein